ncbi:MAG: type IV pilus modification protein PilV [Pseudomonadota bacterium]|nr:type IV pilus modification protein PilV [Pseudomonadota bacterium]
MQLRGQTQRGFSLLEVMVALAVLTVGLLGVLKLEALAYASTNVAAKRSLAALEAASLAASMHINRGYWATPDTSAAAISVTGTVFNIVQNAPLLKSVIGTAQVCKSLTVPCLPPQMAAYDLQQWALTMKPLLPNYTATINCGTANPVSCMINVQWNENAVAINSQETAALANPSYTLYVEP